jgi:thioredoxin-like negative regulator of GroEL
VEHLDLTELGATSGDNLVVQFTHPLCTGCHEVEAKLTAEGHNLVKVDVSKRPDLAHKYQVSVVPTALSVGPDGVVLARLA